MPKAKRYQPEPKAPLRGSKPKINRAPQPTGLACRRAGCGKPAIGDAYCSRKCLEADRAE